MLSLARLLNFLAQCGELLTNALQSGLGVVVKAPDLAIQLFRGSRYALDALFQFRDPAVVVPNRATASERDIRADTTQRNAEHG